ncbi:MAG: glycosyl hydrolase 53 family protein [Robiginitomaculum sp.]|nr:glycosyl hydrolase 53 family protein [Robiginitomaculum sp.]MDQ7077925.1 glycosyl hydrolase 53 family protein [Robiginitomaculum sp.]
MPAKKIKWIFALGIALVCLNTPASYAFQGKHSGGGPVQAWEQTPVFEQSLRIRPFPYGFTTWPFAATVQAQSDLMNLIRANSTFYVEHIDDALPWGAALYNQPFPAEFVRNIEAKRARRLADRPLLLSLNPLNTDRSAFVDDVEGALPIALAGKPMDDPAYIQAYTNYCIWMIDRFAPTYVLSAIESNDLLKQNPDDWPAFDRFSRAVMSALKTRYPNIQFGESLALHTFTNTNGPGVTQSFRDTIKAHIENFDFVGISYYPLFGGDFSQAQWDAAFDFIRTWTDKPLAITESGHPAEPLVVDEFKLNIPFSPQDQADFLCTLLRHATQDNYQFAVWWEARDFDKLLPALPASSQSLAKIFRDMGLWDGQGKGRLSLEIWRGHSGQCSW